MDLEKKLEKLDVKKLQLSYDKMRFENMVNILYEHPNILCEMLNYQFRKLDDNIAYCTMKFCKDNPCMYLCDDRTCGYDHEKDLE